MNEAWLYAISSVIIVSLISLIGLLIFSIKAEQLHRMVFILVSLAVGALFGDALIHLLPEAYGSFESDLTVSYLVMGGFLFFLVVEKYFHWHHHHREDSGVHIHPVGYNNIIADGLHNFIDGILIGVSYLVSVPVGIATTLAVILHEIPQEIGDFGVLVAAGFTRRRALFVNFLVACTAIIGTLVALIFGERIESLIAYALPITAGGFLYIAGTDLLPMIQQETKPSRSLIQFVAIIVGIAMMAILTLVE